MAWTAALTAAGALGSILSGRRDAALAVVAGGVLALPVLFPF